MPVDGRNNRRIITVNGQFPGPAIRVIKDAVIKIVLKNNLPTETLTVHWHGFLQTNNYWMDGSAKINQCQGTQMKFYE
jgi:FtsP/CotA-like multicopper oxidase with cupredoxin domain